MLSFSFARIKGDQAELLCSGFTAANGPAKVASEIAVGSYEIIWTIHCDCCNTIRMAKATVEVKNSPHPATSFSQPPLPEGWHRSGGWILCGSNDDVHRLWGHD